jgi:UDP-N-acetylglucosamine 2-epimerase (non-hydrolysing)
MPLKIINVVGARPNFIKIAPIMDAIKAVNYAAGSREIVPVLVHTGQHYDANMSDSFFNDLEIPAPDVFLGIGSGSHAEQTAKVMTAFEKVCLDQKPDLVLVVGDVNSTVACGLVAAKLGIKLAHVEAGLRSFDRAMPEELNRMVTDVLSDYMFVTEESGMENLRREGKDPKTFFLVGNVMIDTLFKYREKASRSPILEKLGASRRSYGVVTMHRPSNVDDRGVLEPILEAFREIGGRTRLFFAVHPRTRNQVNRWGLGSFFREPPSQGPGLYWLDPLGYLDFLCLTDNAQVVLTDSGGIQEETTALGVPCVTIRHNTERPVTIDLGTNVLVGTDPERIKGEGARAIEGAWKKGEVPPLWDGEASARIVSILTRELRK